MASGYIFFSLLGVAFLLEVSGYGNYESFGAVTDSRTVPGGYPRHHFPQKPHPPHGGGCGGGHRPPGKPFPTHRPHPTFPTNRPHPTFPTHRPHPTFPTFPTFPTTTPSTTTRDPLPPTPTPSIQGTEIPLLQTPAPEFEGFPNLSPSVRPERRSLITPSRGVRPAQRPIQGNVAASAYHPSNRPVTLPADISVSQASRRMVPSLGQGSKDESWLRPAPRPMW